VPTIELSGVNVYNVHSIRTSVRPAISEPWQSIDIERPLNGDSYHPSQADTDGMTRPQWVRIEALDDDGDAIASAEAWVVVPGRDMPPELADLFILTEQRSRATATSDAATIAWKQRIRAARIAGHGPVAVGRAAGISHQRVSEIVQEPAQS